jgi:hypothetical protein
VRGRRGRSAASVGAALPGIDALPIPLGFPILSGFPALSVLPALPVFPILSVFPALSVLPALFVFPTLSAFLLLAPSPVSAQDGSDEWKVEGELGGSFFFGNREQIQFATRAEVERADSLFESATELRFAYGEAENQDGVREVNRRAWMAASALDFRPLERWRPFVSGRIESSFERRIALRYNAGTGVRLSWEQDRRNRVELSVAVQAERTFAREEVQTDAEEVSLARISSSFRVRRTFFSDRFAVDSNSSYRPVFDSFGNFTLSSRNALSYDLTQVLAIRYSILTEYDSGARERGARTNRDGQMQLTLVARF